MRSSALPPIRPEACDKRETIEALFARDKNSAILLTAIYYAHTRHGNCACTCDGVNEEARTGATPRNNLLGLSKSCIRADAMPNNIRVSSKQQVVFNQQLNGSVEAPIT